MVGRPEPEFLGSGCEWSFRFLRGKSRCTLEVIRTSDGGGAGFERHDGGGSKARVVGVSMKV